MMDGEISGRATVLGAEEGNFWQSGAAMILPYEANGNSPIVASGDSECGLHSGKKVFHWLRAHTSNGG